MAIRFDAMPLSSWKPTRDTIHGFAQVIGAVRQAMTPRQRHWFHISLRAAASGLVTPPIPCDAGTFDILLDFTMHAAEICTSRGQQRQWTVREQSVTRFTKELTQNLAELGIHADFDHEVFSENGSAAYDPAAVTAFWNNLAQIDAVFQSFRGELGGATGPVQLWPHHFDLAVLWFSGRQVPGADPGDEEAAEEQMNFGFSTGDEGIPDPYFYATAYPFPDGLASTPLPKGARWNPSWRGSSLLLADLVGTADSGGTLMEYLRAMQRAGAQHMK